MQHTRMSATKSKMKAYMFCIFTLGGCDPQSARESSSSGENGVSGEVSESGPNEDLNACLKAVGSASTKEDREEYCASLSPASRRAQCLSQQSGRVEARQDWCRAEWSNQAPRGYHLGHADPTPDRPCETPIQGENPLVDDCCLPNPPPEACCPSSPVILDLEGDGFELTDARNGVLFDVIPNGTPERVAWTAAGSDDAWLVLDRNENGVIDDGLELFGNYTSQRPSENPNGFIALAVFDEIGSGGNGDSLIDQNDEVYADLQLWRDVDHDGASRVEELSKLENSEIEAINLSYERSRLVDRHGNEFRYRAAVHAATGSPVGADAYDVFLMTADKTSDIYEPSLTWLQSCLLWARGTMDDWLDFCNLQRLEIRLSCRNIASDNEQTKRNWCYNYEPPFECPR